MFASSPPSHLHVVFELLEEMHAEPHHQPSTNGWIGLSGGFLSVGRFPKLIVLFGEGEPLGEAPKKNMNNQKNVRSETIQNHIGDDL